MATRHNRTGLQIAMLVGVCLSLGGYSQSPVYAGTLHRSHLRRTPLQERDAAGATSLERRTPGVPVHDPTAALAAARVLPPLAANGPLVLIPRQSRLTTVSSNTRHSRAPPSA
jgi:hypothetical protein